MPEDPEPQWTAATMELDHVLVAVFGLWDFVVPDARLFKRVSPL